MIRLNHTITLSFTVIKTGTDPIFFQMITLMVMRKTRLKIINHLSIQQSDTLITDQLSPTTGSGLSFQEIISLSFTLLTNLKNLSITQRFIVTEDAVKINSDVHRPQMADDKNTQQQVDFTVTYPGSSFTDPLQEYLRLYSSEWQMG